MTIACYLSDFHNSETARPFVDHKDGEPGERDRVDVRINIRNAVFWKVWVGHGADPAAIPRRFFKTRREDEYAGDPRFHSLPPVFAADWTFIGAAVKGLMTQYGVPASSFSKVELFLKDGITPIETPYWILNLSDSRPTIDRSASEGIEQRQAHLEEYKLPSGITHPSTRRHPRIVALPGATEGTPLWADPFFPQLLFFSKPLGDALVVADLGKIFSPYPVMPALKSYPQRLSRL